MTAIPIDPRTVAALLVPHLPIYRFRSPRYQAVMLESLRGLWTRPAERTLDVGGGTGVIAQCMSRLLPAGDVTAVDVEDRFVDGLSVDAMVFDGTHLPFAPGHFQAATLNNVVHHVPLASRAALFRDIARVCDGPLYIKDHECRSRLDTLRLAVLDCIGNVPFGGMIWARYLSMADWQALAAQSGWRIAATTRARYRSLPMRLLFPNRLELTMRWERT